MHLVTLFSSHGFTQDALILGTIISIPKDKKKSFFADPQTIALLH